MPPFVPAQLLSPRLSAATVALCVARAADGAAAPRPVALGAWLLPSLAFGLLATRTALFAPGVVGLLDLPVDFRVRRDALAPAQRVEVDRAAAGFVVGIAAFFWLLGVLFTLLVRDRARGAQPLPWPIFAIPMPALLVGFGTRRLYAALERAERGGAR